MKKKNIFRVFAIITMLCLVVASFTGCSLAEYFGFGSLGGNGNEKNNQEISSRMSNAERVEQSELQYPETNGEFRYNIYTYYIEITEYVGRGGKVTVPTMINDLPVLIIAENAFFENKNITNLTISEGIVKIKETALAGMTKLRSVSIPSTVNEIGPGCMSDDIELTNVTFPTSITLIPDGCCSGCIKLTTVKFDEFETNTETTRTIEDGAFSGCESLQKVWIPKDITTIGEEAFSESCELMTVCGYPTSSAAQFAATNRLDFEVLKNDSFDTIVKETEDILTKINAIEAKYKTDTGKLDREKQKDFEADLEALCNELKTAKTIKKYEVNASGMSVTIITNSDSKYVYNYSTKF